MENVPYLAESFGESLRSFRKRARLTQKEVADRIGSVTSYIRLLEYGQNIPTLATFHLLCEALNVEPYEFMAKYRLLMAQKRNADNALPEDNSR